MTTEEKAKAYYEALKKIQPLYEQAKRDGNPIWSTYEYLIPELKEESEDERIRKFILEVIKAYNGMSNSTKEKCISYLEKQKYDRMKPIYDVRESFESALEKAWNDYHNGYENADKLEDDYVECAHAKGFREGYLFGIEKQKEQKPSINIDQLKSLMFQYLQEAANEKDDSDIEADTDKWARKILGYGFEQKSEWSKEDEDTYNRVYCLFRDAIDEWYKAIFSGCYPKITKDKVLAMLKSLKDRGNFPKSNTNSLSEWSEEERVRMVLCDIVRDLPYIETELRAHGLTVEKTLAYLEKQKEQKLAEWSEDIIRKGIKEVGLTQYQINWLKNNVFSPKSTSSKSKKTINKK